MRPLILALAGVLLGLIYIGGAALLHRTLSISETLDSCGLSTGAAHIACLRSAVKNLLQKHSPSELMKVLTEPVPNDCHSIGHLIGSEAYKKFGTLEKTLARCPNTCSYACIHGATGEAIFEDFGERYGSEDLAHANGEDLEKIGSKYCTRGDMCHAVGHLLQIAYDDVDKAIAGCDRVTHGDRVEALYCAGGAMMQTFGSGNALFIGDTPPQLDLPSDNDYLYPCDRMDERFQGECFVLSYDIQEALFTRNDIRDLAARTSVWRAACEKIGLSAVTRSGCFESMGANTGAGRSLEVDAAKAPAFCEQFSTPDDRRSCILGRAYTLFRFTSPEDTVKYCSALNEGSRDFCFDAAFEFAENDRGHMDDAPCDKQLCIAEWERYTGIRQTLPDYRFGLYGAHK